MIEDLVWYAPQIFVGLCVVIFVVILAVVVGVGVKKWKNASKQK